MEIAISDAKAQLTDLVRRAENGEEIVLTRHGNPIATITPLTAKPTAEQKRRAIDAIRAAARAIPDDGVSAARSQDFLYGDDGLPG